MKKNISVLKLFNKIQFFFKFYFNKIKFGVKFDILKIELYIYI